MKTAIENDPEFFMPYNHRGIRGLNTTNQELPEADITGVIKELALAYPITPQVYDMGLFMNHFVSKDYSEVVKKGEMLVKLSPYNGGVHNLLGYANMADGDMKATKFSFKNYIKAFPNEANPYLASVSITWLQQTIKIPSKTTIKLLNREWNPPKDR